MPGGDFKDLYGTTITSLLFLTSEYASMFAGESICARLEGFHQRSEPGISRRKQLEA